MIFKNHYNSIPDVGSINTEPSQTIPEQHYTVAQIKARFAQGLPWSGARILEYDNGEDPLEGLNFDNLDISERMEMLAMVNERVITLRHNLAEEQKPKKLQKTLPGSLPSSEDNKPDEIAS